ncbi:transketolase [Puniceibacterium confluentis]|uniref:transketolase n=1 Tax=Puniceibacterium confluentis TaxID=1958944 RepID=UPI001FE467B8|nr:transketolase [Puniceibacterium confluentis]
MKHCLTAATLIVFAATSGTQASPIAVPATSIAEFLPITGPDSLILIKEGKGKDKKANKKRRKDREKAGKKHRKAREAAAKSHEKAEKKQEKAVKKILKEAEKDHKDLTEGRFVQRVVRSDDERRTLVDALLSARAPDGRDMSALLAAVPLALLGQQVVIQDLPERELLTYRNCPPGLAKKDPPCVPPGLAKKGVTYEEWVSYDDDDLDDLLIARRDLYLGDNYRDDGDFPEDVRLLLTSEQIAQLFDLEPAPEGQRYALIDGLPVLLESADYAALTKVSELSRVAELNDSLRIAPTAALTQEELRRTYRLPELEDGYNYAVLNGELIQLDDQAYETLQLIRVARAIF